MDKIGISSDRITAILSESIANGKIADSEGTKRVIAQAIEENNQQLLEDIKKLIAENGTAKFA